MKKTSKFRADFFRRALSMLLALVLIFGDLSMGVQAASDETEPNVTESVESAAEVPTEESTEAPTEEPTEESTEAPTEAPTQASTEAPTEAATAPSTEEAPVETTVETTAPPTEETAEETTAETTAEMLSSELMLLAEGNEITGTQIDFAGYRSSPLDIYSSQYYSNANGAVVNGSGSYILSGSNEPVEGSTSDPQPIVIGNQQREGVENTNPLDADIPISLKSLTMSESMTIKPVGPDNQNQVQLTVVEASDLGELIVENDARLELILDANLDVDSITLGENSSLTVLGSDTLTVSGAFTSNGTVTLNGGTIQANAGISAKSLSLSSTKINANGKAVTATEALSMESSTVENASLFGYAGESGSRTLTLSGSNNTFSNVAAVGCEAGSGARVSIEGIHTVSSSSGTTYYCDYTITYQSDGKVIDPKEDWPVAYRVSSGTNSFSSTSIQGYHTASSYTASASIPLPADSFQAGYHHLGWKLGGSEDTVTEITAAGGDLTLTAVLKAGAVTVKLDRGYDPDQYSNDPEVGKTPERASDVSSKLNDPVSLPVPTRFGYKFTGWKITTGTNLRTLAYLEGTEMSYTVALADCVIEEEKSVVKMEAQWEADTFRLNLFLGTEVDGDDNLLISIDGGKTYQKFRELTINSTPAGADAITGATTNMDFTIDGRSITFNENWPITYADNISVYLKKVFKDLPEGTLPILKDARTDSSTQNFAGWNAAGAAVDEETVFLYGENGMLTPGGKPLTEYQADLHKNNATISAVWGVMSYALNLPNLMPTGWSLTYTGSDGAAQTIDPGQATDNVKVQQGSTVTLTTSSVKPENFSLWGFSEKNGAKILPTEQTFQSGNPYLTYQFTMPAADVTATYGKETWIDIARSPILFEENVTHNNKTRSGFWYADTIDGMTPLFQSDDKILPGTDRDGNVLTTEAYFYQWSFVDPFRVTSNGVATQNQLTLVNALTGGVYFENAKLVIRDAYVSNANGSLIGGVDCESQVNGRTPDKVTQDLKNAKVNLSDYANIVIDNRTQQTYTTKLIFEGQNNTVGAIMQDALRASTHSENPLTLTGDGRTASAVNLGAAFGNFRYTVSNITIKEYTKEPPENEFKYLIYSINQGGFQIQYANIQAPSKYVHVGNLTGGVENASFTDSNVELFSICVFNGINVRNSYLRVRENVRMGFVPIYLEKNAKVVIDGNLEMNYHHWANSDTTIDRGITDNTDNWLIVKGTFCDISNLTWKSGTLICNTLVLGRTGGIQGGTVITNQIINQAVGFWKYNQTTHAYGYDRVGSNQTVAATSNNDDYPFVVYHHHSANPNSFSFSGGKIYLLGYYRTKNDPDNAGKQMYDSTVEATEPDNPVATFMNPLLNENGDIVNNPIVDTNAVKDAVENSSQTGNECIVLGSSAYCANANRRSVEISGNVEIYAAGNITFYNDTTVSGGTISCGGSFGSKGDLTVNGGSITAATVGNAYNLKSTLEDGTVRWKRTNIQGGTVAAQRIGAFQKRVSDTAAPSEADQPKGTVTIGENATIVGTPEICHDVYINYIFAPALFNNNGTPKNGNTLRFKANWAQGKAFADQTWTNTALEFTPPNVVGGGSGNWNWASLSGSSVKAISTDGIAQKDGAALAENQKAYDRIQMKLYAVKDRYDLIFKDGASEITAITCAGAAVAKGTNAAGETVASAKAGANVILTFQDPSMAKDYTVLWYIDGSGIIHSVLPDRSVEGQISFTMPNSDVEVYAAKEVPLDLDITSYTLLQNGFRTEANATPTREDSTFRYLGNLVIHQGSITKDITFNIDSFNKNQMNTPTVGRETTNQILVDDAFDNSTNGRTVTLRRIYQNGTPTSYGIYLEDGAKAGFLLDGAIRTCRVYVPENADLTLKGKNNNREQDAIYPIVNGDALSKHNWASVGNWKGKAGNITLQDLTILGRDYGMFGSLCYSGVESENTVQYINCLYKTAQDGGNSRGWYNRSYFARGAGTVIFDKCDFTLRVSNDWPGYYCDESQNVIIRNGSNITVTHNGADDTDPANTFYAKIKNSLVIENSTLNLSLRVQEATDPATYQVRLNASALPTIELKGNANLVLEQHARLKKLVIGGSSTVKAGTNGDGYLLCENIQVNDNAKLEAGGIIVSGFYNGTGELKTESEFRSAMAAGKRIYDGKNDTGLVVNGGAVTAKEYITGDVNGKVTVNGGVVTAPKIGTTGKLYGYTTYVPRAGEKYIYTYEKIPVGMNISITGGTVNVADYLGGMKTNVSVSGGSVQLGENAVLGLTAEQQTTLTNHATANHEKPANFGSLTVTGGKVEGTASADGKSGGSISVPYGTVEVSGAETGISVYNMMAYCGEMTITGVTGKFYDNPYTGDDMVSGQNKLGVRVINRMSAKNLTITGGSVVYANYAYANVPKGETGDITVTIEEPNRAYLYTKDAHGVIGEGEGNYTYNDGTGTGTGDKNVFGVKVVDVHYIIQPGDVFISDDLSKVNNPNQTALPYYTVVDSSVSDEAVKYYTLQDASCSGYEFLGWYVYDPVNKVLKDTKVARIDKSNSQDVYLGAKWQKVKVKFEIQIEVPESEFDPNTMEEVGPGTGGKKLYKFKTPVEINYGDLILAETGILLSNYTTKTLSIQTIMYQDKIIGREQEGHSVPNTRVSAQMADAFVEGNNKALILKVPDNGTTIRNALITLSQNKNAKEWPRDTKFNLSDGPLQSGSNEASQVSQYGSITDNLGSIQAFADSTQTDDLIHPTAPGYTFGGWYTDSKCSVGEKVTAATSLKDLYDANTTTLYAKWTPNTYIVRFSAAEKDEESVADNRWVTEENSAPGVTDTVKESMDYHWIYDTAPNASGNGFWVQKDSTKEYKTALPYAWREGYVFEGWQLSDSTGEHTVVNSDELSQALTKKLEVDNYVGSSGTGPALTLYAKYRPVKVTYHLDGGKWMTASAPTANPAYGAALAGYSKKADDATEPTDYKELGTATGANGTTKYFVVSTTSTYFADNKTYVHGDYRETLSRKGYTFQGWKKARDDTNYYGCTPRFEDITLTAQWMPNAYTLELHVKDDGYTSYESEFSSPSPATVEITGVQVGSPIPSADNWPNKQAWYAYNKGTTSTDTEKHRLLLGVSFAGLDPGDSSNTADGSVYRKYAKAVTNMFNSKTLFDKGSTFFLPEDDAYKTDLAEATVAAAAMSSVPDYPDGSTIPMYGVYRERSLVFIEEYVDPNGATQSRVMYTHPYTEYSPYPERDYQSDPESSYNKLIQNGYALAGWFVGSADIDDSKRYNESNFKTNKDAWKANADTNNRYDINVYTAYVGQITVDQTLEATDNPGENSVGSPVSYTLPGSMQDGTLSYQITTKDLNGLNLVSVDEMKNHQYDSEWTNGLTTYTANNTVAIELKLEKDAANSITKHLTEGATQKVGDQHIGKDWKITLTLYHSKVMTQDQTYQFTVEYTFEKRSGEVNELEHQWLKENVTVTLKPSVYQVKYQAILPEANEALKPTVPNGFTKVEGSNVYSRTIDQNYDTALLGADQTLTLEGYDRAESWSYAYGTDQTAERANLTLEGIPGLSAEAKKTELSDGQITVSAGYVAKSYTLEKEDDVDWIITYSNGATDTGAPTTLNGTPAKVKYHSVVTFTPNSSNPQDAAYITLTYTDGTNSRTERLYQHQDKKQENGSYIFPMPAENVTVGYSDVMDLYLDNGTIELFPDGFKQACINEGTLVTWPGNYRIWQCEDNNSDFHGTENVLKLSGDLADRTINLGNLNIISVNSIELQDSCEVNLTQEGKIQARNILAPEGTTLTVTGAYGDSDPGKSKTITLEPDEKHAAIGGSTEVGKSVANGTINLDHVDVVMALKAPSVASGIGPGMQDIGASYGPVTVTNSRITVSESASYDNQYTGAWIGGAGVSNVSITGTKLLGSGSNHNAKAVDGNTVALTDCQIGDDANRVKEPIHAANALTVTTCQIYQQNDFALGDVSMIGTDSTGTTKVTNSTVQIGYGGNGKTDQLFTGKLMIEDAVSDITINGTQIVEVNHGSIEIQESGVTQNGTTHSHSSLNYLLLEEKEKPTTPPNLTVSGLGAGKTITVHKGNTVTVGALDIRDDAKVILDGNLKVTGGASVAKDQTLTVEGKTTHDVTYQGGLSGDGSYVQTGGTLTGKADVVVKGNMTLTNVTADCGTNKLGSSGGSAPTSDAEGTATTVTISGGSVTASTVGACGAQNETFTFVKLESTPAIAGNLVQDHYRLNYEVSGINVTLKDASGKLLPTVLRTETPYGADGTAGTPTVHDGIPANPTGEDASQFKCWFIWDKDGTARLGLLNEADGLPTGLTKKTLLSAATVSKGMSAAAADGTTTLNVYAWLNLSGTETIQSGRLFQSLTNGATSASVSTRGAWTAKLESNGTFISGRDYQVTFDKDLPAGTDLTLTSVSASGNNKYYHLTLASAKTEVKFSDFTKMGTGTGAPPTFTDGDGGKETFFLSADFGELANGTVPTGGAVNFSVLLEDGTPIVLGDPAKVSYTVTPVTNGVIEADADTVTVTTQPSGEERRTGKHVYLVATLSKTGENALKVPLNTSASLTALSTAIDGQWISGNTVAFELGSYGNITESTAYTFSFEALPEGAYSIAWKLCTGEWPNVLNGVCSNTENSDMAVAGQTWPMLKVTSTADSHVLAAGSPHTLSFNYETNADFFTVTVEKQGILANFTEITGTRQTIDTTTAPRPVSVEIPADAGTYRVRFSLPDGGSNDDVYYAFIVE